MTAGEDATSPASSTRQTSGDFSVSVEEVGKTFQSAGQSTHALDTVDLRLEAGEFVAVVGPSGCGKSTLMRIIAGLIEPSEGRVMFGDRQVTGPERHLGIVFQSPILLEWRNVLDNVLIQVEMRGRNPRDYTERAKALLEAVGLGEFMRSHPFELSGGMQQRAAIVRALIHDPALLLMDEPFGALDALTREQLRLDLEELWLRSGKTVLFITHSIDEAVMLADRVVVMSPRPGRIERILDVDIVRPRGLTGRQEPNYQRAVAEITDLFMERGVLRTGGGGLAKIG